MASEAVGTIILVVTMVIAFNLVFSGVTNFSTDVGSSIDESIDRYHQTDNTDISISDVDTSGTGITVFVENTGERTINISKIHFILDGSLEEPDSSSIEFSSSRVLLEPYETGEFEFSVTADKIKVVTSLAVSDSITV